MSVIVFEKRKYINFCSITMDRSIHVDDLDDQLSYIQPSFDGFVDLIKNDKKVTNNIINLPNCYFILYMLLHKFTIKIFIIIFELAGNRNFGE